MAALGSIVDFWTDRHAALLLFRKVPSPSCTLKGRVSIYVDQHAAQFRCWLRSSWDPSSRHSGFGYSRPFHLRAGRSSVSVFDEEEDDTDGEDEDELDEQEELESTAETKTDFRLLKNKEKKELRAYAHSLGRDINCQQVGKAGITPTVIISISDALEANELVKVKVLDNCSDDMDSIVRKLTERTKSQVIGTIGHTILLYRASTKKLEAYQKRQELFQRRKRPPPAPTNDSRKPKSVSWRKNVSARSF